MAKEKAKKAVIGDKVIVCIERCWDSVEYRAEVVHVYRNGNIDAVFKNDGEREYAVNFEFNPEGGDETFRFAKK